jgi:hypothetical protein
MPTHTGKVISYIVGHEGSMGRVGEIQIDFSELPTEREQNRFVIRESDPNRPFLHDCFLVALANNLTVSINYESETRAINYAWVRAS